MVATPTTPCIASTSTGPCSQGFDLDGDGTLRHSGVTSRQRFAECFSQRAVGHQDVASAHESSCDPGRREDDAVTARVPTNSLRLSIVLATDTYETIRPVLSALRRQSCAREIEPIIVLLGGGATAVRLRRPECVPSCEGRPQREPSSRGARRGNPCRVGSNRVHRRNALVPATWVGGSIAHRVR